MERGSYCYFCGTNLNQEFSDSLGSCYGCPNCPPSNHWRWNEDTEFLQLYVGGERCPYCDLKIPASSVSTPPQVAAASQTAASPAVKTQIDEYQIKPQRSKKPGKPVTIDGVWWASVVEWCRANNGHDVRNHHNCSKELARMQTKGEATVVWHNRDRVPGTKELIASGSA